MMKVYGIAFVLLGSLGFAQRASAQWAVVDVGAIAQLIQEVQQMEQAVQTAENQLNQAKAEYQSSRTDSTESQREMLRRLALPRQAWEELSRHASERKLLFLSTPFDEASAELLERMDIPAFKVASGEVTNHPFLERLARSGRPLLMSTGMSDLSEVDDAVRVVRDAGAKEFALFHCTSSYPAPLTAVNLRAMGTLRARFGVPTGYSDHTLGCEIPWAATAQGADLLEKHITLDRAMKGPDHAASMEPREFAEMVSGVRAIAEALGDGIKRVQPCELDVQKVARRSLFARADMAAGHVLTPEDVISRRPATGLPPSALKRLLGRPLRRAVTRDALLDDADFG